jgi:hypothetical protein
MSDLQLAADSATLSSEQFMGQLYISHYAIFMIENAKDTPGFMIENTKATPELPDASVLQSGSVLVCSPYIKLCRYQSDSGVTTHT